MEKIAYPQEQYGFYIQQPRNISKWMGAMKQLYAGEQYNNVTSSWDDMEKLEFKRWMAFYQENSHNKYKTAQYQPRYIDNGPGSLIPSDVLRGSFPTSEPDMSGFDAEKQLLAKQDEEARKESVKKKIQSIIGRLNSAERLATQHDVQIALKKSLQMGVEEWVATLQKLKRDIQLAPLRASLVEDLIYKNANQVASKGFKNEAKLLVKIAQMPVEPTVPQTAGPADNAMGAPILNPADAPMAGQPVGEGDKTDQPQDKAMQDFLSGLSGEPDKNSSDDEEEDSLAHITVTAQMQPPRPEISVSEEDARPQPQANIQVTEDEAPVRKAITRQDPFDVALSNITMTDIVGRLEAIASMFKNREIARQLSIIDLMMDKKGIAPFFPTLAEAMRSALESNQYCQSRIEEILAKLRGTMETPMSRQMQSDISGDDLVKENLAIEEQNEKARKQQRKLMNQQAQTPQVTQTPAQTLPSEATVTPPAAGSTQVVPQNKPTIPQKELAGPAVIEPTLPIRPE